MSKAFTVISHGPCCPNHGCELELTQDLGIGICPISRCRFEYSAEVLEQERSYDKFGNEQRTWKMVSIDGDDA